MLTEFSSISQGELRHAVVKKTHIHEGHISYTEKYK